MKKRNAIIFSRYLQRGTSCITTYHWRKNNILFQNLMKELKIQNNVQWYNSKNFVPFCTSTPSAEMSNSHMESGKNAQIQKSPLHMLWSKSCSWKHFTDISEKKTWPFSARKTEMGKRLFKFLKICPHFLCFNSIEINDWALIFPLLANGLSEIKRAANVSPTQPLAILAVTSIWSGHCLCSECLVPNSP